LRDGLRKVEKFPAPSAQRAQEDRRRQRRTETTKQVLGGDLHKRLLFSPARKRPTRRRENFSYCGNDNFFDIKRFKVRPTRRKKTFGFLYYNEKIAGKEVSISLFSPFSSNFERFAPQARPCLSRRSPFLAKK
jgi:hypothetical protein